MCTIIIILMIFLVLCILASPLHEVYCRLITIINSQCRLLRNSQDKYVIYIQKLYRYKTTNKDITSIRFHDTIIMFSSFQIRYELIMTLVWRLPSRFECGVDRAVFPCMVDNNGVVYAWVNGNGMHLVKIFPNGSYVDVRDFSSPTYIWYCLYEPDSRRIILVGDRYDGYAYRAAVFVWYIDNDTVRYVIIPFTSLDNWLMSAVCYRGYYFFGEWERSSRNLEYSSGTYYPDSGGVWIVPADQILNSSAYRRIWEEPGGLGIYQFAVLRGHLYVFAKNATLARVYEYVNGKFILVREFRDVHASTVRLGAGLWSYSCDAYWQPGYRYLFIACQNTTTRTVHILTFDGKHWTDWNTGIPVNLDDYGVRITVMPDQKTVILQIMNSKTWEEHSIRTVYALYLDSHRIEPILVTLGTGGAFKMTYVLNKNCFAVGEYNKNNRVRKNSLSTYICYLNLNCTLLEP